MKSIAIIGTGPAGLMAGYQLLRNGCSVSFYDQKKAAGRKFLVAGHGGFNLTHSLEQDDFRAKYNHTFIQNAVSVFSNQDTIHWLQEIGIPTFVGSSGKIFPEQGIKPIEVLNAWLSKIEEMGGQFYFEHELIDFNQDTVTVQNEEKVAHLKFDYVIFSLGGASWKKTGSTGSWLELFKSKGLNTVDFQSSNAGMNVLNWNKDFDGIRLKNCKFKVAENEQLGEILFTDYGIEGAPVYAMNDFIRKGIKEIFIDLKPTMSEERVLEEFKNEKLNRSDQLSKFKLSKDLIAYLKSTISKDDFLNNEYMSKIIKNLPFTIDSLRPIDEAISTVGGIDMNEINQNCEMIKSPNHYCVGEMLDWDAPTGGFLLQACFSTGFVSAQSILEK